jgi:uncharacterized membrane protein (DUF106 family)
MKKPFLPKYYDGFEPFSYLPESERLAAMRKLWKEIVERVEASQRDRKKKKMKKHE